MLDGKVGFRLGKEVTPKRPTSGKVKPVLLTDRILCVLRKFYNSLSLVVKAWVERIEKSASLQHSRNWFV